MLKVEIKEREEEEHNSKLYLVINEIPDLGSKYEKHEQYGAAYLKDEAVIDIILNSTFEELAKHRFVWTFPQKMGNWDNVVYLKIVSYNIFLHERIQMSVRVNFDLINWNKPYSPVQLSESLQRMVKLEENIAYEFYPANHSHFGDEVVFIYLINDKELLIKDEVQRTLKIIDDLFERAKGEMLSNFDQDSLLTVFRFPESIKTACEQYLVYFGQFLKDLGIEVHTEIQELAHDTLFKVTPKEKNEALATIQEALNLYLNIPGQPKFEIMASNESDIGVLQLQANVSHLKGQLALSKAIIQAKDSTIEALQLSNYQYRSMYPQEATVKVKDEEQLIEGILAVKKVETKGLSINLPEIIRRIKRRF